MRVCIISSGPLGSNPRVVKEADALVEAGHRVTAIATRTLSAVDDFDETILANAAWCAHRLDFRGRGVGWQSRRVSQITQAAAHSLTGFGYFADRAISPFAASLIGAAKKIAAELYIAHYPGALPAAAIAAHTNDARYAYDAEDFHFGEWPDGPEFGRERRLLRAVEGRYLANCAYVTAASPGIADAYVEAYGIVRPAVVLNVFRRSEAVGTPGPAGKVALGPSVYWFSQTIGSDRGLEVAVAAIGRARTKPHLYLRGSSAQGFVERLRSIAAATSAPDRLHILPSASPLEMVRLAAMYDVGLSSEPGHNPNNRIALGNKLFTYLLAGIPAVLSDVPAHRAFATEAGSAVHLYPAEDVDGLAAAIDALIGNPHALSDASASALRLGLTRFNWDVEKNILLNRVDNVSSCQKASFLPIYSS